MLPLSIKILNLVIDQIPEILFEIDALAEEEKEGTLQIEITLELISKMVLWDKKNKRLKDYEYRFLADLAEGKTVLTERNKKIAKNRWKKRKNIGFAKSNPYPPHQHQHHYKQA